MKSCSQLLTISTLLLVCSAATYAAYPCPDGPTQGETIVGMEGGFPICESAPQSNRDDSANYDDSQWEDRWISVASGDKGFGFGAATDMPSKRKAENTALEQCRKVGGKDCRIDLTTNNACIAIANGQLSFSVYGYYYKKRAEYLALERCAKDPKNAPCAIYYSACSFAVRVN